MILPRIGVSSPCIFQPVYFAAPVSQPIRMHYIKEQGIRYTPNTMNTDHLQTVQDHDLLGIVLGRRGVHYTTECYAKLYRLACIDTKWRSVATENVSMFLREHAEKFMLDVAILYQIDNFATIVLGLIHFQKLKSHPVLLYGITALYVACSTSHHVREAHVVDQILAAGGVEAVIGSMVMNPSYLELQIIGTRMLEKLSRYMIFRGTGRPLWTKRQSETAERVVLEAVRQFPLSLDMQSCGMSCFEPGGLCRFAALGNYFEQQEALSMPARRMYPLRYDAMDADIRNISIFMDSHTHWSLLMDETHVITIVRRALLQCMAADFHLESVFIIIELAYKLTHNTHLSAAIGHDPLATSVCLRVLQQVCAHIDTETPGQAIDNQKITRATILFLDRLFRSHDAAVQHFVSHVGAINVLLQAFSVSHTLSHEPPPLLFNHIPCISYTSSIAVVRAFCGAIELVARFNNCTQTLLLAGALPLLVHVSKTTYDVFTRTSILGLMLVFAERDNSHRLLMLNAGVLPVLALWLRPIANANHPVSGQIEFTDGILEFLSCLAKFPVYATAMFDLGFVYFLEEHQELASSARILEQIHIAVANPVYA